MKTATLAFLRCPYCGGRLEAVSPQPATGEVASGILRCGCGEFPVLGGIPIFKRDGRVDMMMQTQDAPLIRGPHVRRLTDLIRAGRSEEALLLLLVTPDPWIRTGLDVVELLPEKRQGRLRRKLYEAWARRARKQTRLFLSPDTETTARDAFTYYYRESRRSELYNHFFHRFSQPRHLSSLGLATLLADAPGPVLDLACGFGHTLHFLTARSPGRTFVGLDRNYFELYAAKRWIAPDAEYVCAEADGRLPFGDGTFAGTICSDAFHYFLRKRTCADELLRVVAEDGAVILTRVGNALQEPREGYELDPAGYRDLFPDAPSRLVPDADLTARYLGGSAPDLSGQPDDARLQEEKWLSLVVSRGGRAFRNHGRFDAWPHGAGRLRVNPLYVAGPEGSDGRTYALRMPSKWFDFENRACRTYMPDHVTLSASALADVDSSTRSAAIEDLIRRCVVLGLPEKYF